MKILSKITQWFSARLEKILFRIRKFFKTRKYIELLEEEKFSTKGCSSFKDPFKKNKIDNIIYNKTYYIKHNKTGRVLVVRGEYPTLKRQYENDYTFKEPMIKDVGDEWDEYGNLINEDIHNYR